MGIIGYFLPILILGTILITVLLGMIEQWLTPKNRYEIWLEDKLRVCPEYINFLKVADAGKNYKLGKRALKKVKGENVEKKM